MNRPKWLVLNKRHLAGPLLALTVLALVFLAFNALSEQVRVSPEKLLDDAINKSVASQSYRFSVEVKPGGRETFIKATGERVGPDKVSIKGTVQKTSVEYIQIGEKLYLRDSFSNRWLAVEGSAMAQSELFMLEFNPLGLFIFKEVPSITSFKQEKSGGKKYYVVECSPIIKNPFLELKYTDFKCKIWVDPSTNLINEAALTATTPANERDSLHIHLKLWDYNEKIEITAPNTD